MDLVVLNGMKADLECELVSIEERLAPLQDELQRKRSQLEALERLIQIEAGIAPRDSVSPARGTAIADCAFEVLTERKEPLHYQQLVEVLQSKGVAIPGRQPGTNLIAHLSRDARFARVGSGTYGLSDWGMKTMPKRRRAKRGRRT